MLAKLLHDITGSDSAATVKDVVIVAMASLIAAGMLGTIAVGATARGIRKHRERRKNRKGK